MRKYKLQYKFNPLRVGVLWLFNIYFQSEIYDY